MPPTTTHRHRPPRSIRRAAAAATLPLVVVSGLVTGRSTPFPQPADQAGLEAELERLTRRAVPGIQYVVVRADGPVVDLASGLADVATGRPMTPDTTLMAYSMTKTLTAVLVLGLVEEGVLGLDDPLDRWLPDTPYGGQGITVRHLLAHTAGVANPIPLRWVHPAADHDGFDEAAALAAVVAASPTLDGRPGAQFRYSNIGYWLLGAIVEAATGRPFEALLHDRIVAPLGLTAGQLGVRIPTDGAHAAGYLARSSPMQLVKRFVTDPWVWAGDEGAWTRVADHHLDGPAFGGAIGSARAVGRFLQDQLSARSRLLGPVGRRLLHEQQTAGGQPIAMTLGWHMGTTADGVRYLAKEGGGAGFHAEMRLYPGSGIGTVVMVNATEFDSSSFLDRVDAMWHASTTAVSR